MTARLAVAFVLSLFARPVLADEPPAALQRMEWQVGGVTREALVHRPGGAKGAPVVFVWHGHGGTMRHASSSFSLHTLWPEAIVVYPQGLPTAGKITDREGRLPGWQFDPGEGGDRDLKFFDAMLASFPPDPETAPRRVYVTGHSNGGRFVYLLWATRAGVIDAFAPSASPAGGLLDRLAAKPCLHLAGQADQVVPFAAQQRTINQVRRLNHCDPVGQPWGQSSLNVTLYPSPGQTPLITAIQPGGHKLSGEAPALIVKFFKSIPAPPREPATARP